LLSPKPTPSALRRHECDCGLRRQPLTRWAADRAHGFHGESGGHDEKTTGRINTRRSCDCAVDVPVLPLPEGKFTLFAPSDSHVNGNLHQLSTRLYRPSAHATTSNPDGAIVPPHPPDDAARGIQCVPGDVQRKASPGQIFQRALIQMKHRRQLCPKTFKNLRLIQRKPTTRPRVVSRRNG